jgi:hypothetical protein
VTAEGGTDDVANVPAAPETNPGMMTVRPAVPGTPVQAAPADRTRAGSVASRQGFTSLRDLLSFLSGVAIIAHEVWFASGHPQVAILTVGVALAGLPVVFGADEKRKPPSP